MTREEAIRILDPVTTGEAIPEIEYYGGFSGRTKAAQAVSDACILAVAALREQEERRWIPVSEPPKKRGCYFVTVKHWLDGKPVVREARWNGVDWLSCYKAEELTPRVTHWQYLPEPPKEGNL